MAKKQKNTNASLLSCCYLSEPLTIAATIWGCVKAVWWQHLLLSYQRTSAGFNRSRSNFRPSVFPPLFFFFEEPQPSLRAETLPQKQICRLILSLIYADIFFFLECPHTWNYFCTYSDWPQPQIFSAVQKKQIERGLVNFQTMIVAPLSGDCTICKYVQITLQPCFNFTLEQEYLSDWCGTLCSNFCNFTLKGFFFSSAETCCNFAFVL